MSDTDKRAQGLQKIGEVYGDLIGVTLPPPGANRFIDFMLETLFADLWACETLSFRDRRLLILGVIAAQGEESVFRIQAAAAMKRGELTAEQLQEAMLFLTQYVGYPRASRLNSALNELLKAQAAPR
jgi:4-carboxymuconolactone decarboxylase